MPKESEAKVYKCPHQGCNYQTTKEGYLTQHVAKAHGQAGGKKAKKDEKMESDKCPDCGGLELGLLNPRNSQEKYWIEQGYTKVCKKCKEVI